MYSPLCLLGMPKGKVSLQNAKRDNERSLKFGEMNCVG